MASVKTSKLLFAALLGLAVFAAGCQPKNNRVNRSTIGRNARGTGGVGANGVPTALQPNSVYTQWGEVTSQNQQAFGDAVYYFTQPMLANASQEDAIGFVSAQSGQQTGVVFWGEAPMVGAGSPGMQGSMQNGQLDPKRSRLHIEIWDSKTGQARSDGSLRPQTIVHIGYDQEGFVSAQGYVQGGQVSLTFTDQAGSVMMTGTLNGGQYFTGQMYFQNGNGQQMLLGNFQVPACGFFTCN